MATTWDEYLDIYEGQISSTEEALRTSGKFDPAVLGEFAAPDGLGPFPDRLVPRASAILERNLELSAKLGTAIVEVQEELATTGRAASAAKGYIQGPTNDTASLYFDKNA